MKSPVLTSNKSLRALTIVLLLTIITVAVKYQTENAINLTIVAETDNENEEVATESYQETKKTFSAEKLSESALPTPDKKLNEVWREEVKQKLKCKEKDDSYQILQHGNFWLLKNIVKSSETIQCHESITYTTHSDFTFLDNLLPLLDRWRGPVSLALWSPGEYFNATINSIFFLRNCLDRRSRKVRQFATFHMFFESKFLPSVIPRDIAEAERDFVCPDSEPFLNFPHEKSSKSGSNLTYPVNVGRNLARDAALTHFVLASDIELYPSPNLIDQFFEMILKDPDKHLQRRK